MCGINGFLSFGNSIDNGKAFVDGKNTCISHRGPDDKGYWATEDRKLHFGHLRLSIIDLSPAGHQPMITAAGTVMAILLLSGRESIPSWFGIEWKWHRNT